MKRKPRKIKRVSSGKSKFPKVKFSPRDKQFDFLKWWRVVRRWALQKHGISQEELEVMLYLYDEGVFTRTEFREFEGILTWDKQRLNRFIERGWIVLWRDHKGYQKYGKRYTLSTQAKQIVNAVYKKLLQIDPISENREHNPMFAGSASYTDQRYQKVIKMMNEKRQEKKS